MNFNAILFLQQSVVMFLWIALAAGAYSMLEKAFPGFLTQRAALDDPTQDRRADG